MIVTLIETYNIQRYETGECYVETGRKSESN